MSTKRWIVKEIDRQRAELLQSEFSVSPVIAQLLTARGHGESEAARRFLHPSLDQLHDPALMLGMKESVARVQRAIDAGEKILIYGDYDVDGTTGTVVLRRALQMLGGQTGFHVPHRFTEGYGIQQAALEKAVADGFGLVISVDCGIRAHEPLHWAREHGLDVIVTDHHLPDDGEGAPPAFAVLNPNQRGCNYPDKNLAGVGVAFKLAHALFRERGKEHLINGFLKMVAIGTVADVAQLVGENRAIVALGLADLSQAKNHGLRALMEVAGCGNGQSMTAYDLGFRLGPRINAAGRMDAARAVVELFEATGVDDARRLAAHLDTRNRERQEVQREILNLALTEWGTTAGSVPQHVAVIAGDGWHRGVIGIAASKISEKLHRPCVVISLDGDVGHGSGRSIEAYHLLDGLTECADLFEKFGGHSHAAGLTIKRSRVEELRTRLNAHAASALSDDDLIPAVHVDAEVDADQVNMALAEELHQLEPFGAGNPRPLFATRELRLLTEPRVMKDRHLKLRVAAGNNSLPLEAVWWDGVERLDGRTLQVSDRIELAYTIEPNSWQGVTRLQLNVKDLRILESDRA
jgi:single-stranded-DNA-specific exonuclease